MPRILPLCLRPTQILRHNASLKFFALIAVLAFTYVIWAQYPIEEISEYTVYNEDFTEEAIQNVESNPKYAEVYRKKSHLPKDLKYILRWTRDDFSPFDFMGKGQRQFIKNNCSMINCYVTSDKNFFGGDLKKFHAIAFNGRNLHSAYAKDFPRERSPHQKYIYFNTESADNQAFCSDIFDDMFNWTATYRFDSDILYNYIVIKDRDGNIVGPKPNMTWVEDMEDIDDEFAEKLQNKSKAAAWFVSHCDTRSKREQLVSKLQRALKIFDLNLDVYGSCGPLKCPRWKSDCDLLLERDYYFYMSLENSFAEDYVTEKLLTALQHDTVPIVFGGADYSRFLPPGSYLDARDYSPIELAAQISHLMQAPRLYRKFFRWKKYYTYEDAEKQNVCNLCEALNNRTKFETITIYHDFRKWWNVRDNPDQCSSWFAMLNN